MGRHISRLTALGKQARASSLFVNPPPHSGLLPSAQLVRLSLRPIMKGGMKREMEPLSVTRGKLGLCASASYTPMVHQGIEGSPDNHSMGCKTMSCTSPYKDLN